MAVNWMHSMSAPNTKKFAPEIDAALYKQFVATWPPSLGPRQPCFSGIGCSANPTSPWRVTVCSQG